jgi:hypothetical protein
MKKSPKRAKTSSAPKKRKKAVPKPKGIDLKGEWKPSPLPLGVPMIEFKPGVVYSNTYEIELTFRDDK